MEYSEWVTGDKNRTEYRVRGLRTDNLHIDGNSIIGCVRLLGLVFQVAREHNLWRNFEYGGVCVTTGARLDLRVCIRA